jgi:SUKH-3 immunity protein
MISRADAEAKARGQLGPQIGVEEFDTGYVAWLVEPPPVDPTSAPVTTGRPTVVVDKETGELTTWSSLPTGVVAAQYTAHRAAAGRFAPDVRAALERAGWWPGRDREAAVIAWLNQPPILAAVQGIEFSGAARAALIEFGGLRLPQLGPGGTPGGGFASRFFPIPQALATQGVREFTARTGIPATPIGDHDDGPADLVIDPDGRVFLLHQAGDYVVGDSLDAALGWLVRRGELRTLA